MSAPPVATAFRFRVVFAVAAPRGQRGPTGVSGPSALGTGGFSECTGLEVELEVSEYQEGGHNDTVVQRAGRAKYAKLVLRRGMLVGDGQQAVPELWSWLQDTTAGVRPLRRYDGFVQVLGPDLAPVATWRFRRALPAKVSGPQLNARTGEVAIEELQLAHEGLWLVTA